MSSPLKIRIMGRVEGEPVAAGTSVIFKVPAGWYVTVNGKRTLLAQFAGRELRAGSERIAAAAGEKLHHADWVITSDPAEVRTLGLMHDCATCRAGVDQATAFLRDNPDGEVAVGQLRWAGQ